MDNSNGRRHQDPAHFMRQNDPNRTSSLTDGDSDEGPQRPTSASHYNNNASSQVPTSVQSPSPPSSSSSSREQGINRPYGETSTPAYIEQAEEEEQDGGKYSSSPAYDRNNPNMNPELMEERLSYAQISTQHGNDHYQQQKNQHHQHQQYQTAVGSLIHRDSYEINNNNNNDYATDTYDRTTRSPGGGGGARRGTGRAERVISSGGPGNFLSHEMGNLSMDIKEPSDPTNNYQDNNNEQYFNLSALPLQQNLYEDQYQYSHHEEQYPPQYQSPQQHQLISAGRLQRPANLPQPRAGTPPIADDETFRSRILDNLDLPPQRLGRRCLTFKRSKRLPDRVMGVIVEGTESNTPSPESDAAWIKIECIGCQSSLQVPKESVIVECPICHGFHPVASCHVRSRGR